MQKKGMLNKSFMIMGLFVIIILILSVGIYFYTNKSNTQSLIPNQCTVQSKGISSTSYTCPSTVSSCTVGLELNCNQQISNQRVIFRGSSSVGLPSSFAIDSNGDGALEPFTRSSGTSSPCVTTNILSYLPEPYQTNYVYYYNGIKICSVSENKGYIYVSGGVISTENTPLSNEACDGSSGFIRCAGNTNVYQCSQSSTVKVVTVSYSGSKAGSINKTVSLLRGESIGWNGKIYYSEDTIKPSECTQNMIGSSPSNYYECKVDTNGCGILSKTTTQCENGLIWKQDEQKCGVPYSVKLTTSKTLFSTQEDITGTVQLQDTTQLSYIPLVISLVPSGQTSGIITLTPSTDSSGKRDFNFGKVNSIGDYTIVVTVSHPSGTQKVSSPITVTTPIFLRLTPDPSTIQYSGDFIKAKAFITDASGDPASVKSWDFTGTKCGTQDLSKSVEVDVVNVGIYELSTKVSQDCNFFYQATATDNSGFKSSPASTTIQVKKSSILIKPDLSKITDGDEGRYTISFKTLDSNLQPIETNNIVKVTGANTCESGKYCPSTDENLPPVIVDKTAVGQYSFTYNFKSGLNVITIDSSSADGRLEKNTQDFPVNLFANTGSPISGGTGTPTGLIIGAIVLIAGIAVFFYLIFKKRKRK